MNTKNIVLFIFAIIFVLNIQCQKESGDTNTTMLSTSYPFPIKKALVQGIEIAYMDEGEGPHTLLFLHGLGSYAPAWNKNLALLKDHYRCIAIDFPGYGFSQKGNYAFTMSFFAEIVEDFITTLKLGDVILVGHSMGGQVAMTTAIRQNAAIEKLVLVAPAGFEPFTEQDKFWTKQMITPSSVRNSSSELILRNFEWNFATGKLPNDANFMFGDRVRLKHHKDFELYCNMIPKCAMGMLNEPLFDRLYEINLPTLITFGREDYLIPNRMLHPTLTTLFVAKRGQQQMANSELLMLSPCGHFVQWECADRLNVAILDFVGA
jgi:pimeloyl-ACP methyl ester carboxylesterase